MKEQFTERMCHPSQTLPLPKQAWGLYRQRLHSSRKGSRLGGSRLTGCSGVGRSMCETLVVIYLPVNVPGGSTKGRKLRMPQRTEGAHITNKIYDGYDTRRVNICTQIHNKALRNASGRMVQGGMVVESVPPSGPPPGGGWPEPLLIPSTDVVFGVGPLPF